MAVGLALLGTVAVPRVVATFHRDATDVVAATPSEPAVAGIGEAVRNGPFSFAAQGWDCGAARIDAARGPIAQGQFCRLRLTVRNESASPRAWGLFPGCPMPSPACARPVAHVVDEQSRRYAPDAAATQAHPDNAGRDLLTPVTLNPGSELAATLVFDIPIAVDPVIVLLGATSRWAGSAVSLRLTPGP